ncbi:MAG: FtsX-like permease family protein [Candidatus Cloacimonetes bacterium]|nr:FtsX-like permease family protein [Candidatus Cloacimonadota bacterium]MBL7085655.1 FtsX-like permease family protein [Candidatus Cloacimonadota bacterium]
MYHIRLAYKYLKSESNKGFSLGNIVSIIGIFLGVFTLIVVMSVMNGLEQDITHRIIGLHSEIKIFNKDYTPIKNWNNLVNKISNEKLASISPICQAELMLLHDKNVSGIICQGIQLNKHIQTTLLMRNMYIGTPNQEELKDGIILGSDIAVGLQVNCGDIVSLISPIADQPTPFGLIPKSKNLKVVGLFYTGIPEYDMKYSFTDLETLQQFMGMGSSISFIEIMTGSPKKSRKIAKHLKKILGNEFEVLDWQQFEKHLFTAMKFEKKVMFFVLILIFLVAAFNMIGNYLKLISHKREDIGILKSIGATAQDIVKIFMLNGLLIGMISIISGLIVSLGLLLAQIKWHFIKIPITGMPFQSIPVKIEIVDLIIVAGVSLIISLLTTIIPAYRTTKIDAIKVIREGEE